MTALHVAPGVHAPNVSSFQGDTVNHSRRSTLRRRGPDDRVAPPLPAAERTEVNELERMLQRPVRRVAVTGATGHVGINLVTQLSERGIAVNALSHEACVGEDVIRDLPGVKCFRGDVRKLPRNFLRDVDVVYHLAAKISISDDHDPELVPINVDGTANVVRACVRNQVPRFVYCSSIHALQQRPIVDETCALVQPGEGGEYDQTKAASERLVQRAVDRNGLNAVTVNPTGIFGPHDYRGSFLGTFFRSYWKYAPAVNGAYDYVDVRDVCDGMVRAAERGKNGERYILGGEFCSIADLTESMSRASGEKPWFSWPGSNRPLTVPLSLAYWSAPLVTRVCKFLNIPPVMTRNSMSVLGGTSHISSDKAKRELGYRPRSLASGVEEMPKWVQQSSQVGPSRTRAHCAQGARFRPY